MSATGAKSLKEARKEFEAFPKQPADPETRAIQWVFVAGVLSFFMGFLATAFGLAWLFFRLGLTKEPWWEIVHMSWNLLIISFIGGAALATVIVWRLDRWFYRRGVYRCPFCDRPFKSRKHVCDCPHVQALMAETTSPK